MNKRTTHLRLFLAFSLTALTLLLLLPASSNAQQAQGAVVGMGRQPAGAFKMRALPPVAAPIMERVRVMREVARVGRGVAPPEAQASYREAENAFTRLLASAGLLRNEADAAKPSAGAAAATTAQSAADIRALKSLAKRAPFGEAAFWNRAAEMYATGARCLLTAQLRDALFAPPSRDAAAEGAPTVILEGGAER